MEPVTKKFLLGSREATIRFFWKIASYGISTNLSRYISRNAKKTSPWKAYERLRICSTQKNLDYAPPKVLGTE